MKKIIKKVIDLTKANGGEIAWNDIPAKTQKFFFAEIKSQFEKEYSPFIEQGQLNYIRIKGVIKGTKARMINHKSK